MAKEGRKEASYWQKRFNGHDDRAASAIAKFWRQNFQHRTLKALADNFMQSTSKTTIIEVFSRIFMLMRTGTFLIDSNEIIESHSFFDRVFNLLFELSFGMTDASVLNGIVDQFYLVFCDIVQSAALGVSVSSLKTGAEVDFNGAFIVLVRNSEEWEVNHRSLLPQRIVSILRCLYMGELETPPAERRRDVRLKITKLRSYHHTLTGENGLDALDAEIEGARQQHRSVQTIVRYWRLKFKYNTLHSLVCQMRKKGLFFDDINDQKSLHELLALTQAPASVRLCRSVLDRVARNIPEERFPAKVMLLMLVLKNHPDFIQYDLADDAAYCATMELLERFTHALRIIFTGRRHPVFTIPRELILELGDWWDLLHEFAADTLLELNTAERSGKMDIANLLCEEREGMDIANLLCEEEELDVVNLVCCNKKEEEAFKQSFDASQHGMKQQFDDRMLDLRLKAATLQSEKAEFFQKIPALLNVQDAWLEARRHIQEARILIQQVVRRQCVFAMEGEQMLHRPEVYDRAFMGAQVRPAAENDPKTMDTYLAKAIIKDLEFNLKVTEYVLHTPPERSAVFDLGKAVSQFLGCKMIMQFDLGQYSFSLIKTKYAPCMILTRTESGNTGRVFQANSSILIHNHQGNNNNLMGFAIVEIKCCSFCSKPAHLKCPNCWTTRRLCVRYCSAQCKNSDSRRHAAVCGNVESDDE